MYMGKCAPTATASLPDCCCTAPPSAFADLRTAVDTNYPSFFALAPVDGAAGAASAVVFSRRTRSIMDTERARCESAAAGAKTTNASSSGAGVPDAAAAASSALAAAAAAADGSLAFAVDSDAAA
jgi:hypothetical protein